MAENQDEAETLIIDTNVIISCLPSTESFTRACFILLKENGKMLSPKQMYQEVIKNLPSISRRYGIDIKILSGFLVPNLFRNIEFVDETDFKEYFEEASQLVNDSSDTPFVALALKKKPCTIVTKNKKDYKINELEKLSIDIFTSHETLQKKFGIDLMGSGTKLKRKGGFYKFASFMKIFKKKFIISHFFPRRLTLCALPQTNSESDEHESNSSIQYPYEDEWKCR